MLEHQQPTHLFLIDWANLSGEYRFFIDLNIHFIFTFRPAFQMDVNIYYNRDFNERHMPSHAHDTNTKQNPTQFPAAGDELH